MLLRTFSFFLGIMAILAAAYLFLEWDSMGFPDGHLTDFQRAVQTPFIITSIGCACLSICFFYLPARSSGFNAKMFWKAMISFALLLIAIGFLAYYYRIILGLENGEGG